MIIRPRTDQKPTRTEDPGKPKFKMGMVRLAVSAEKQRFPVEMKTSCDPCQPGMLVKTTIRTEPNAEVSLAVADRAVLDLLNYRYEDPVNAMYRGWPMGVRVLENRGALIDQLLLATKGDSPGGGGDEDDSGGFGLDADQGTRRNFRYTAYWNPTLKADDKGEIKLEFKLPDNLTTFRFMALAARDGRYGKGEQEIRVRRDIVIQKLVPRFIRPGDRLELGSLVVNATEKKRNLKLSMQLPGLKCQEKLEKTVSLDAGATGELTELCWVPIPEKKEDLPRSGQELKGSFSATESGRTLDAMEFAFPVLIERYREAFATSGIASPEVAGEEFLAIPDPDDYPAQVHSELSSTIWHGMEGAFKYFQYNPYLCLEQRSSAYLITLVTPDDYLPQKFFEDYSKAEVEDLVLKSLSEFQNDDGGFRLWKEYSKAPSSPYTTAYVVLVLQEAKKRGRPVPQRLYDRAEQYLRKYAAKPDRDFRSYIFETLALIHYVLRDRPVSGLQNLLMENRESLSLRSKAYILLATLESGNPSRLDDEVATEMLQEFTNQIRWNARRAELQEAVTVSYRRAFYSGEATLALWIRVLTAWKPEHPLVPRLMESVVRRSPYRSNSHSEALLAQAVSHYHEKVEKSANTKYTISLDGKSVWSGELTSEQASDKKSLSAGELRNFYKDAVLSFNFKSNGPGRLYYTTWIEYTIPPLRPEPASEGIEIQRTIQPVDQVLGAPTTKPLQAGEDEWKRGEIYLVRLTVTASRPLSHFVLRDPIPSHSEIVNTQFATESAGGLRSHSIPSGYWWAGVSIEDYRDDAYEVKRTYLPAGAHQFTYLIRPLFRGKALYPAASAYSMYEPEIFGRSADAIQEVE
jgi:uncharacterized protein YfaS (alpha-2-macroglobulin family)